jgi:hypothetical protein
MKKFTILSSATAAAIAASTAMAGPLLTIQANVGGYAPLTTTSTGVATTTSGSYSYIGGMVSSFPSPDWAISWDLLGEDTAVYPTTTFLTNGFRVQNLTSSAKTFDITVSLASPGASNLSLLCTALLGGTLTSDAAGTTASLTSTGALWTGQVNGISRTSSELMNPANVSTGATTSFGPLTSSWTGTVTGALTSIGYRMQFTLGAKSTAVFTGYWEGAVVPAPGALATLAVAGIVGRRRRTA